MSRILFLTLMVLWCSCQSIFADSDVVSSCKYQQKNAQLITYSGEVALPFQGFWRIKDSERPSQVQEVYLQPDLESIQKEDRDFLKSKFTLQKEKEQKI